jgi:isoamylase
MVTDSLRYWVEQMHVDGFRFDLAATLGREQHGFDPHASFFGAIRQDRVLGGVKLIAEPWDVGPGGYQVGNFPPGWFELNDRFRDVIRQYWKGDEAMLPELAARVTGSADLFQRRGCRAWTSVNKITSHDGFTLQDVVSYNEKHNEANGEDNRDGHNANYSWNHGVEGPTDDPAINALREQQKRNMLAILLFSHGTPMILGGDEFGRTQRGNNNAWCQDNELSWFRWDEADEELLSFARRLIRLRLDHRVFRRQKFLEGRELMGSGAPDVWWFRPDGRRMTQADWRRGDAHTLGVFLNGREIATPSPTGEPLADDSFLMLFNAWDGPIVFTLPPRRFGRRWALALSTWEPEADGDLFPARGLVPVEGRSIVVLRSTQ